MTFKKNWQKLDSGRIEKDLLTMLQVQSSVPNIIKTVLCSFSFFFIWLNFVPAHSPHPQPPVSFYEPRILLSYFVPHFLHTLFSTEGPLSLLHVCIDVNDMNWCLHRRESLRYLSLWVWVSSLHIRLSNPVYFPGFIFFFTAEYNPNVYVYPNVIICWWASRLITSPCYCE